MSEAAAPRGFEPLAGATRLLSDERLVRRATKGDERAFATIFRRYHQDLFRFCLAIVGNPHDAQDALQNAMVKVMRALPGERREIQLKPWLYRIAHNESIEVLRRRMPSEQLDPDELTAVASSPAEDAEQRARLRRLVADMAELPERQRGALVMRELADLKFEEIGAALGTSAAVVRQTLYEARLSLRQMEEGRELSCDTVTRALSDADGRITRRRDIRAHLRECEGCRDFGDEVRRRRADFAALAPLPGAAAVGILQGILGSGSGGGAAAGAAGAGAGTAAAGKAAGLSALGGATLVKGAATVAVVAAIGVGATDRSGVVDLVVPGRGGAKDAPTWSESRAGEVGPAGGPAKSTGARTGAAGENGGAARSRPEGVNAASLGGAGSATNTPDHTESESPGAAVAYPHESSSHGHGHSATSHGQGGQKSAPGQVGAAHGNAGGGKGEKGGAKGGKANGADKGGNGYGVEKHGNGGQGNAHGATGSPPHQGKPPPSAESGAGGPKSPSQDEASAGPGPAVSSQPESANGLAPPPTHPPHPEHPPHP